MEIEEIRFFARKMLGHTSNMDGSYRFPVTVSKLRSMCNFILEQNQDKRKTPLTEVESKVLQCIKQDIMQGIQPTIRTVCDRLGYKTPNSAAVVINRLMKHGYIERDGSKKQIVLVNEKKTTV
jgi:hypothetical protein